MHKLMFGDFYEPNYYLNVNSSNLSSGNYMLHAEVTFDPTKNSTFGTIVKQGDKLFYFSCYFFSKFCNMVYVIAFIFLVFRAYPRKDIVF